MLRPYQLAIFNEIPRRLVSNQSVLIQSPARSGKSHIISETAARICRSTKGLIVVVLTHRDKIQKQLKEHCNGISINSSTGNIGIFTGHCYVAMQQTIIGREKIIKQLQSFGERVYLIVDEAHRGDFNKTFEQLPQARRIGFTATPAYKWAKHLPLYYASLIHGPQPATLIELGNITPVEYHEMQTADLSTLVKRGGEYTEQSQSMVFDKAKIYDGLFQELPKFKFNKCIVFCASKKSADLLNSQFLEHGYDSICYYSGMKNGQANLVSFDHGPVRVMVTVSTLAEGYDNNKIDLNILWRATTSLPLFIQMAYRNLTPHPNKQLAYTLDFGGNNSRFGGGRNRVAITMDRDWHALWQPEQERPRISNGVAPIKNCTACDYIISAMARSCSNCGYIFPKSEIKLKDGELVKIEEDLKNVRQAVGNLGGRRISTLNPQELALYAVEKNKKVLCMRVAKSQELKQPGFAVNYGRAMKYKSSWATRILMDNAEILMYDPNYKIDFFDCVV